MAGMTVTRDDTGRPYWISWYQTEEAGEFELHTPWWISGYALGGTNPTICAAVMAVDEAAARERILASFDRRPDRLEFRFVTAQAPDWSPYCDRFQAADWMRWPA